MPRLPYAARTLIAQVLAEKPRALWTFASEPDGLNVVRTVRFDKRTSRWLSPLLDLLDDERIAAHYLSDGRLFVRFHPGPLADRHAPFPLSEARTVAEAGSAD
jgi:hypothetical protein